MTEGVRKFEATPSRTKALSSSLIAELNVWRDMLFRLELIGKSPVRYDGYAYGNVSELLPPFNKPVGKKKFLISGSQTSGIPHLDGNGYTIVTACDATADNRGRIEWRGPIEASSESMTHAAVYDAYPAARFVYHTHSPEIWKNARALKIPVTNPKFEYGTPEIAKDVARLFKRTRLTSIGVFTMGGHEDGVVSFGTTSDEAGMRLISFLAKARLLK